MFNSNDMNRLTNGMIQTSDILNRHMEAEQKKRSASGFFDFLKKDIQEQEAQLSQDEQLFVYCCAPNGEIMTVEAIEFIDPILIKFIGHDGNSNKSRVIMPLNLAQVLTKVVKVIEDKPKRPIGFIVSES